ncbi:MAG: rhomboid family intramembrane serine protease [Hymenobacter sp.]|nr:MAG: rhomboid family intramembrane serine protease [Hymenobacter sp.]
MNPLFILLGLTVAVSVYAWSNQEIMDSCILDPYRMNRHGGQWYRFLTSGFLHADWGHLVFNMITLYSFGGLALSSFAGELGATTGVMVFLLLYLGGIVVSDLPTYFRHRHDPGYRSLGASGGVSSVLFAGILFNPVSPEGQGIMIFPIPFRIQPYLFGFLYLAYSHYMGRRRGDNINHDAHFYGALYGILLTLLFVPSAGLNFWQQVSSRFM